ncbi:MAG: hypothetical protein PUK83_03690 [Clostridia bacterium]|nr:hypothetical protein [Clostridia bacterium]MDY5263865.1 hypothetical protein [Eubacteriales bacterium]MDY5439998.1 hypothetical protein [Eubacteriales bacterium]
MEEKKVDVVEEVKEEKSLNEKLLEEIENLKKQISDLDLALWKRKWILWLTCLLGIGNFIILLYILF